MTDIKLYSLDGGKAGEIQGSAAPLEKSLQNLIEQNLEVFFSIKILGSEYSTGLKQKGRIDTLGIDENNNPVIIEYKRATNENVINQGLFYLDWLLDHQAEFKLLVLEKMGKDIVSEIDPFLPRLLCIAGGFTRYDVHAIQQINRNIELIRYRRFGERLLMLELVNANLTASSFSADDTSSAKAPKQKSVTNILKNLDNSLKDIYLALRAHLMTLGDDVQEKTLKYYIAYKRLQNFACVEIHPSKAAITMYLKVNPDSVNLENGFSRDVRKIGHYGTGDLEITIRTIEDIERVKPLLEVSYEAN